MQIRLSNAPDAPAPVGQYTHAVEVTGATRTVYISGQVGAAMDGSVPEDATEQGRNDAVNAALANDARAL